MSATITSFSVYLVFLMGIGVYFYKKTASLEDYLIGGRAMGSWVTALSAQASDMSGWLLMGLPGAVYLGGISQAWIAIGLFIGTVLNWKYVAARLRVYTEKTNSMTLPSFFEKRFGDSTGLLRIISAAIILLFFTIYSASGLVASGKLFESLFNIEYKLAVIFGGLAIVSYTFLGGFMAVSWTDFFQGILMFFAITIVPTIAYGEIGGMGSIIEMTAENGVSLSLMPEGFTFAAVISAAAWGLGYFGQPHILVRFMGIDTIKKVASARKIAVIWVAISLTAAVFVGIIAVPMFPNIADSEKVFIEMIAEIFNPWIGGILLAAILSAIMSTIDSQLLVSSSTLTEDFYNKIVSREASESEKMWAGRAFVIIIAVIAFILALNPNNSVLGLVSYAWAGLGAAFGPVVLFALFSRKTSWRSVLTGMLLGTITLIYWKESGLGSTLYEIVPGFLVNVIVIMIGNKIYTQKNKGVLAEFDEVQRIYERDI
ncbi:sodium/proline symporter PutP [Halanaerobium congolense]|jgi:sodium/proline symporter|uniref:Sodium/proline symporter n=1 Tax=Halanaerobium congolense TaxID=54121 RepID=A0A1G6RYH4_9FIRM|nr:sodium/proline symporter PutP [Halanaerobium congolense]PUU92640.1 MAG: sodium/proline symporter [Halanaerobium sp.]PTX17876.1 sodium/proline symporter [Halanaerobium congolense]PXV67960.1 sodium/proline symporter [Halanaerobium congolense]TDS27593.1 sodium/proline symporter [Halanaerobium congolense]SDD09434.1 sodium/proline symporter [Halanaerobium congolense]